MKNSRLLSLSRELGCFVARYSIGTIRIQIELSKGLAPVDPRSHYLQHLGLSSTRLYRLARVQ